MIDIHPSQLQAKLLVTMIMVLFVKLGCVKISCLPSEYLFLKHQMFDAVVFSPMGTSYFCYVSSYKYLDGVLVLDICVSCI